MFAKPVFVFAVLQFCFIGGAAGLFNFLWVWNIFAALMAVFFLFLRLSPVFIQDVLNDLKAHYTSKWM